MGAKEVLLDGTEAGASGMLEPAGPTEASSAKESVRGSQEFRPGPAHGLGAIVALTCFNFPYGMIYATIGVYILPYEALRLWPSHESLMVGLSVALIGLTQLTCPVIGVISDNHGKRKPFMFAGGIVSVSSLLFMSLASLLMARGLWLILLVVVSCGLNVIYSAQTGLIADQLKDQSSRGTVSGVVAVHLLLGSTLGFLFVAYTTNFDFQIMYFTYCVVIFVSVMLVCYMAVEDCSNEWLRGSKLALRDLLRSFTVDRSNNPDFFWVLVARTIYYVGTSGEVFLLYYLRDMVGTSDEATQKFQISIIALLGQSAAAVVACPAGYLSERSGRKILVYLACSLMCFTWAMLIIMPYIWTEDASYESYVLCIYFCAVIYGIGNGAYLSVELALALDCLPDGRTAAKDLGIWSASAFIGSAIGPLIQAFSLELVGRRGIAIDHMDQPESYHYAGYLSVLAFSFVSLSVSALIISFIRRVR
mmetsp:Transcript_20536/g.50004  ORF Transcript_20536/g.50004 Transcript_20536/m.50004 type:complete len:476 (-) Transcript_20536:210-1637(-)